MNSVASLSLANLVKLEFNLDSGVVGTRHPLMLSYWSCVTMLTIPKWLSCLILINLQHGHVEAENWLLYISLTEATKVQTLAMKKSQRTCSETDRCFPRKTNPRCICNTGFKRLIGDRPPLWPNCNPSVNHHQCSHSSLSLLTEMTILSKTTIWYLVE